LGAVVSVESVPKDVSVVMLILSCGVEDAGNLRCQLAGNKGDSLIKLASRILITLRFVDVFPPLRPDLFAH
jgi:hypothetical protein